jgi:hypothetical protein
MLLQELGQGVRPGEALISKFPELAEEIEQAN